MTFEKDLERMEEIAAKLRAGNTSLEESLTLFEEGMKLSANLEKNLETAKRKVKKILSDSDGAIREEDFSDVPKDTIH
jgi:exodeoxyribonuclease VII small subunit